MRLIELEFLEWKDILWTRFIMRPTWVISYEALYNRILRKLDTENNDPTVLENYYRTITRKWRNLEGEYSSCMENDVYSCDMYLKLIEEIFRGKYFPNVLAYLEIKLLEIYQDHSIATVEIGFSTPTESESIPSLPEKILKIVKLPLTTLEPVQSDEEEQRHIIWQVLRKERIDPYDWRIYMSSELRSIVEKMHNEVRRFLKEWKSKVRNE